MKINDSSKIPHWTEVIGQLVPPNMGNVQVNIENHS